jgi:hypothetical protein
MILERERELSSRKIAGIENPITIKHNVEMSTGKPFIGMTIFANLLVSYSRGRMKDAPDLLFVFLTVHYMMLPLSFCKLLLCIA